VFFNDGGNRASVKLDSATNIHPKVLFFGFKGVLLLTGGYVDSTHTLKHERV